jgi:2-polyprenyl-6-methoxyphenol hydroxylase-like FAD-dependent oxidoreductase
MQEEGSRSAVDALVVGAGPVGLTMAAELARHGVRCRLVDRSPETSNQSKALALWSRSLEMLDDMGAAEAFVAAGRRMRGASIHGGGAVLASVSFEHLDSPYAFALMLPQSETERLLAEHLARAGIRPERGIELVAIEPAPHAVTAVLRHGDGRQERARAAWLLGCDGAHSTVRHGLGVPFAGEAEPNDWMLADVHVDGPLDPDRVSIFFHQEGVLACFPITARRFRLVGDVGPARNDAPAPQPTPADLDRLVAERGPAGLRLHDVVWLTRFRIHERKAARYRTGRVFLAGDAAHIHSPAGGQGMNTGMQDAYNLAWKLALVHHGHAPDALLDTYDAERGPIAVGVLRSAAAATRLATLRAPVAQALRNHVASFVASFGPVQQRIAATLAELEVGYPGSPLSVEASWPWGLPWVGGVRPGARLPDAELLSADTHAVTRLHHVLRGTAHTVLLLDGLAAGETAPGRAPAAAPREVAAVADAAADRFGDLVRVVRVVPASARPAWRGTVVLDPHGAAHRRLGAQRPSCYLVRPDGHVGHRSQPADAEALLAHLGRWLPGAPGASAVA